MTDDVRWLTYDELSSELGITRESARQLVIRKRWSKSRGNDGKARVGVPEELLHARTSDDTGDDTHSDTSDVTSHDTSDSTSADTGADTSVIRVLTRHIERLEKERDALSNRLLAVEAERDEERLKAAIVEPLKATVELLKQSLNTEKHRTEDLRQERDRWASALEASQRQLTDMTRKAEEPRKGWFSAWLKRA